MWLDVAVIDPPRDTGGIEVSHYLLQVDSGAGMYYFLQLFIHSIYLYGRTAQMPVLQQM